MKTAPAISIITPVYNGEACLPAALASIRRQDRPDLEHIIIDDGSKDDTAGVVRRLAPAARYFYQPNGGCPAARNAGLARVRTPLVAFLDADDEWPADALRHLAAALQAHPEALFVLGRTRFLSKAGDPMPAPWVSPNLGAGLYRREAYEQVGNFNVHCDVTEDIDWFLRAREKSIPYVTIEAETLHYWRRPGSQTAGKSWDDTTLKASIRASLARRRLAGGGQARELNFLSGSAQDPRATGLVNQANEPGQPVRPGEPNDEA